jgi:hypothetical protein
MRHFIKVKNRRLSEADDDTKMSLFGVRADTDPDSYHGCEGGIILVGNAGAGAASN